MIPTRFVAACAVAALASSATAAEPMVDRERFVFPLPAGYADVTERIQKSGFERPQVTVESTTLVKGYRPTIMFQRAPIAGGTQADEALCKRTAANLAGPKGRVKRAGIVQGPLGRTCQIHVVAPEGVALVTELNLDKETWLMTCNHADGDDAAERVCRTTLDVVKIKK